MAVHGASSISRIESSQRSRYAFDAAASIDSGWSDFNQVDRPARDLAHIGIGVLCGGNQKRQRIAVADFAEGRRNFLTKVAHWVGQERPERRYGLARRKFSQRQRRLAAHLPCLVGKRAEQAGQSIRRLALSSKERGGFAHSPLSVA
jgi:hypothetical protein